MKTSSESTSNNYGITEVCGSLFTKLPTEVILFGYFETITISGWLEEINSFQITINGKMVKDAFIDSVKQDRKTHFSIAIPVAEIPGETSYNVVISLGKNRVSFPIQMAGPLPDNLQEKELFHYLKNQIWNYHRQLTEKTKRVHALEHSLSWKITRPLRIVIELAKKMPLLFSKQGLKALTQSIKNTKGTGGIVQRMQNLSFLDEQTAQYQHFRNKRAWEEPNEKEVEKNLSSWSLTPTISMLVPTYNTPVKYLNECVESVLNQSYTKWELCIYDDASNSEETLQALKVWSDKDDRIKVRFGKKNLHIPLATNEAKKLATGAFLGLLDHDDLLHPNALYEVVKKLNEQPKADFIYSDEDKLSEEGVFLEPYFKPDFNPDLFLSNNYLNHFSVMRTTIFDEVGGFRKGFEGSQDYDLFLRIFSKTDQFYHIPKVLYHWRKIEGSTAADYSAKSYPEQAAHKALEDYLKRNKVKGSVEKGIFPGSFRIKREVNSKSLISIIIPFKDEVALLQKCLTTLKNTITYPNTELILVNNNSEKQETFDYLKTLSKNYIVLNYKKPFNYSAINNFAVSKAKGDVLLLLNNDIEAISKGWFETMLEHIQRTEVGAVGAKLSYPDYTLQHAGVILGINGVASHGFKHLPSKTPGYFMRANAIQNLSACTAACLMVKKEVFNKVGGFDEQNLKIAFNDIDLCLKIREAGYLITYTPFAHLIHHESKSRGFEDTPEKMKRFESEIAFMRNKWGDLLQNDPYYNPNLTLTNENFSLRV